MEGKDNGHANGPQHIIVADTRPFEQIAIFEQWFRRQQSEGVVPDTNAYYARMASIGIAPHVIALVALYAGVRKGVHEHMQAVLN